MHLCFSIFIALLSIPLVPPDVVSLIPKGRGDCPLFKPSGAGARIFTGHLDDDRSSNSSVADLDPPMFPAMASLAPAMVRLAPAVAAPTTGPTGARVPTGRLDDNPPSNSSAAYFDPLIFPAMASLAPAMIHLSPAVAAPTTGPAPVAPARNEQLTTPPAAIPPRVSPNAERCSVILADTPLERPSLAFFITALPEVLSPSSRTFPVPPTDSHITNTSLIPAPQDPALPSILFSAIPDQGDDNIESKATFVAGGFALIGAAFTTVFALALLSASKVRPLINASMVMVPHR